MDVLQGRYLKKIKSKSGQLKGLKLETPEGIQTIYLPKALRDIAAQELAIGDVVRIWTEKPSKKGKKGTDKKKGKQSKPPKHCATGLIPLSPKLKLDQVKAEASADKAAEPKKAKSKKVNSKDKDSKDKGSKDQKSKDKKSKGKKSRGKLMTVQLCQKRNCCKKGGTALWEKFEGQQQAVENSAAAFKLEAVGCLGGCKRGPNIRFLPKNVKHYHVQPDEVAGLLKKYRA